tara:strand:- start:49 stop:255 length:207 start_codon:yes stop_codon:yes gene_type:complete
MLDVLLATMSFIAAMSMFFLCWLGRTLNKQLRQKDNLINELKAKIFVRTEEVDMLVKKLEEQDALINQ